MVLRTAFALVLFGLVTGCAQPPAPETAPPPPGLASPYTGYESHHYKDPSTWLCLPGRDDACAASLDATELLPESARVAVHDNPSPTASKADCFYVYPTVDLSLSAANHQSFADLGPMARTTVAQAARFRNVCRLFVPLYRQATIGAYLRRPDERDAYLAVAASDVVDAFVHYMATYNGGRKVVLIGHSQGAEMVNRLLRRLFDDDPVMRSRLLLAFSIGGKLDVAAGSSVGGTFSHIPVCSHRGETGCVVAYRSYPGGRDVEPDIYAPAAGHESVCVNPAELDAGPGHAFSRAFFPVLGEARRWMRGVDTVGTPFVMLRDFYRGQCVTGRAGFHYLAVSESPGTDDSRVGPIDLSSRWLRTKLGLHILDLQFAQGDLVDLVAHRVAALP